VSLARSSPTLTPPDAVAEETSARFATIPMEVPFVQLLAKVKDAVREHIPLVEAVEQLRRRGFQDLPAPAEIHGQWTPAQEKALAQVVAFDPSRRLWIGSLEVTELIRRQLEGQVSSVAAAPLSQPSPGAAEEQGVAEFRPSEEEWRAAAAGIFSPLGGKPQRGFWFSINAELIVYGATDPDAKVVLGDRTIQLRPDGSFSFRYALPDGVYALPVEAHSPGGEEKRVARLNFLRQTLCDGEVGAHPQEPTLKPPTAEALG
jgi:hypothetical protein